ncbi:BTB/POZ domain-containing protein KCTD6 [Holothuria leucospilota]|uniref:BTB/POZ domain-containing protein KCTD6 n=1 Tax=Holothuria leucospilota TaxID=206669 RepID=A0A9Q1C597_HOLLE|nr:BTB/POZ domain-containing protein KCTD6 [Holothuria leucospilota]
MGAGYSKDSYVCLNVGGTLYSTTLSTLTSVSDSMLESMFREGIPATQDPDGHIFIDRDGTMFRYVLNFMRDKKLCLPSTFVEYDQLLAEAEFFQLPDLKEAILLKMSKDKEVVILTKLSSVSWNSDLPQMRIIDNACVVEAKRETWPSLKHLNNAAFLPEQPETYLKHLPSETTLIHKCFELQYFRHIAACLIEDGFSTLNNKELTVRRYDYSSYNTGETVLLFTRQV